MSTGLNRLLELKKQQAAAKENAGGTQASEPVAETVSGATVAPEPESVPEPAPAKVGGFKLNLAGAKKPASPVESPAPVASVAERPVPVAESAGPAPATKSNPLARLAAMRVTSAGGVPKPPVDSAVLDGPEFTLGDLANAGVDDSVAPPVRERSHFYDEIDAQAPVRELPEELTPQQKQFIESLDGIYTVLDDAEMFGQLIRNIMMELQGNPEYLKHIVDQDVHTMMRAMRNTMGLARMKKQESKAKRGNGGRKTKAVSEDDAAMLATLEGLAGFDGDM
jgi:hypothetical protein